MGLYCAAWKICSQNRFSVDLRTKGDFYTGCIHDISIPGLGGVSGTCRDIFKQYFRISSYILLPF